MGVIHIGMNQADSNGFNIQLELMPITSNRIVLRKYTPKEERR